MVLFQAQNKSWKALSDLWAEDGQIISYKGVYDNFGTGFSYRESELGGQFIGRNEVRITEPCNHVSSLSYYKLA